MDNPSEITYIGKTDFRNANVKFGIKALDRTKHAYIIGKTGMGKSTFLENMIIQDIQNGNGLAFIDPHGDSATKLLNYIPKDRIKDVIYINPSDTDFPVAFNPLEDVDPARRPLIVDGLMTVFKKIWPDAFSGRMEYILNNTMLALLEYPDPTLLSINRFLTDKDFRKRVIANIQDPTVKNAWEELSRWDDKRWSEAISALINKVGQFTTNPVIRNIVGQPQSTFDFRRAMDERKIIIIDLSKGKIGEQNQPLFGAMLITKIYLAAMSRADLPLKVKEKAPPFYFYVDEFQNFANDSFANILSEARKYKLCLTVANQYVSQMAETVRDAVFGNMGTTIAFRVGPLDSELLEKVFAPVFTGNDLVNLEFGQYYITLQIDGMGSRPFSAKTIWPLPDNGGQSYQEEVIAESQARYGKARAEVESQIIEWFGYNKKPEVKTATAVPSSTKYVMPVVEAKIKNTAPTKKPKTPEPAIPQKEIPVTLSETMSGLLDQLDNPVPVKEEVKQAPEKKEIATQQPSVKSLEKPIKDRAASPATKNALFEALQKAQAIKSAEKVPEKKPEIITDGISLHDTVKKALTPELVVEKTEEVPVAPKKETKRASKVVREVPEDILKKLLE